LVGGRDPSFDIRVGQGSSLPRLGKNTRSRRRDRNRLRPELTERYNAMSEHWYKNGVLADQHHADWPKTKAGTPRVSPPKAMMVGLGFKPSVTSILSVVGGAGGLLNWYAKMGMQAYLNVQYTFKDKWKEELNKLTSAAAEEGTRFHQCIEEYLSGGSLPDDAPAQSACINVHNWITSRKLTGGRKEHIVELEEHQSLTVAYAGTVDYWIEVDDMLWVIDIKTKNTARDCRPEWKHVAQCAAYAHAIDRSYAKVSWNGETYEQKKAKDVRCVNLYISRETGELGKAKVWTEEEMEIGMELFGHASWVWKTMNTNKIT
jgi:hypothetical protein